MPKILVCASEGSYENYTFPLRKAGFDACPKTYPESFSGFDCVIFCGGGDIDSKRFGKSKEGTNPPDLLRDKCEFAAFSHFFREGKAIFGICRGMQLINVALGGTLFCHLETAKNHMQKEGADIVHKTSICKNSVLYNLFGDNMYTNSAHHQGIEKLGRGLVSTQSCVFDGVCEAIEHESGRIFGFQWHPERMTGKFKNYKLFPDTSSLFSNFFEIVQKI